MKTNFLWGAATSAHQIDGNSIYSDWWEFEQKGNCEGGVKSGQAADHWNRLTEDLLLLKELGMNSYRFSFEWSRLETEEGSWDEGVFDWYEKLFDECERHQITPMATLHHFTSPLWFAHQGGFTQNFAAEKFLRYVTKVIEHFGKRCSLWITFNEPMVLVVGGYLGKFMPPGDYSPKNLALACHQLLKAHVGAYKLIHSHAQKHGLSPRVGIAHNLLDFKPDRKWHPLEKLITFAINRFYNESWLEATMGKACSFSVPFLIPKTKPVEEALGKRTVDFIGVNYYTKAIIQWRPRMASHERSAKLPVGVSFARRKDLLSDMEWAIYPKGLGKVLKKVAHYGLPIYITENGIADQEDKYRPGYLITHLKEVATAHKKGIPILGYFYWSLMDNFEWSKGFAPRFGLYRVNFDTFKRTPTASALIFKDLIATHRNVGPSGEVLLEAPNLNHLESHKFSQWIKTLTQS